MNEADKHVENRAGFSFSLQDLADEIEQLRQDLANARKEVDVVEKKLNALTDLWTEFTTRKD